MAFPEEIESLWYTLIHEEIAAHPSNDPRRMKVTKALNIVGKRLLQENIYMKAKDVPGGK
jgi:hypothetical protein